MFFEVSKKAECELHKSVKTFLEAVQLYRAIFSQLANQQGGIKMFIHKKLWENYRGSWERTPPQKFFAILGSKILLTTKNMLTNKGGVKTSVKISRDITVCS